MSNTLYVANLAPETGEEDLRALFGEHGAIESLVIETDERSQQPVALVEMETEKRATRAMNELNGYLLNGRRLAITPADPDLSKDLTAKQRKVAEQIVEALGEEEKVPVRQIHAIVRFCSTQFAQAILEETEELEADGGVMTSDGTRRRTKGGVFFYLCRFRISPAIRRIVYNRKGKVPGESYD